MTSGNHLRLALLTISRSGFTPMCRRRLLNQCHRHVQPPDVRGWHRLYLMKMSPGPQKTRTTAPWSAVLIEAECGGPSHPNSVKSGTSPFWNPQGSGCDEPVAMKSPAPAGRFVVWQMLNLRMRRLFRITPRAWFTFEWRVFTDRQIAVTDKQAWQLIFCKRSSAPYR